MGILRQGIERECSTLLTDPTFEKRLKNFDPRLKLIFDQLKKRWVIVEWALDNSGWNVILTAQHEDGTPKPLGEWVFNCLWVYRQRHEKKQNMGLDNWLHSMRDEADAQRTAIEESVSDDHKAMLREDVTQWRKVSKELDNMPPSDATAGYPKIDPFFKPDKPTTLEVEHENV